MLGAERLIYVRIGDEPATVRIDEATPPPAVGATVHLSPRADKVHAFDATTHKRLTN